MIIVIASASLALDMKGIVEQHPQLTYKIFHSTKVVIVMYNNKIVNNNWLTVQLSATLVADANVLQFVRIKE